MKKWILFFTIIAASAFAEKFECKQAVPAFDTANPAIQKGVFDPGAVIEIVEFAPSAQMYLVRFTPPNGSAFEVYCRPADVGKSVPTTATEEKPKEEPKEVKTEENAPSSEKPSEAKLSLFECIHQFSSDLWEMSANGFKQKNPEFRSLSQTDKSNWRTDLKMKFLDHPTYETIARFENDKLNEVTILVFGRGDAKDELNREEFDQLTKKVEASLDNWTQAKGIDAFVPANALNIKRRSWFKLPLRVDLDSSVTQNASESMMSNKKKFRAEFLRLTISPYDGKKTPTELAKPNYQSAPKISIAKKADLKERIQHKDNDVFLEGVPMIDQGQKGYCVVASAERVLRYYGLDVDQNEIAKIANTKSAGGTSTVEMFSALKKLGSQFRFSVREYQRGSEKMKLLKAVTDSIDQGYPILWSVMLGTVKEDPPIPQAVGGHMRLIIGYNKTDSKVIYTDSWGARHEFKHMLLKDAYLITEGLYTVSPNQ
jgi:hypothetical protein